MYLYQNQHRRYQIWEPANILGWTRCYAFQYENNQMLIRTSSNQKRRNCEREMQHNRKSTWPDLVPVIGCLDLENELKLVVLALERSAILNENLSNYTAASADLPVSGTGETKRRCMNAITRSIYFMSIHHQKSHGNGMKEWKRKSIRNRWQKERN